MTVAYGTAQHASAKRGAKRRPNPLRRIYNHAVEPISYGYPLGRVRVLEGRLLPRQRLERLIEARDFTEQRRILSETGYGELFADANTAEDVEAALDVALERAYDFMEESFLPEPIVEFFRVRYDFLNLRILLKVRIAGASRPGNWSVHGSVPAEVFEEAASAAEDSWLDSLPERLGALAAAIAEAVTGSEQETGTLAAAIDTAVDKALYERIRDITCEQESPWFVALGRLLVDWANARIALRAARFGKDSEWLAGALIEGGNVPVAEITKAAGAPAKEVVTTMLEALKLPRDLQGALAEKLSFETMDVAADNAVLRHARGSRLIAVGLEPIVGYLLAVENEIMLLRIVLVGKLANLSPATIHERVRELNA